MMNSCQHSNEQFQIQFTYANEKEQSTGKDVIHVSFVKCKVLYVNAQRSYVIQEQ